MKKTIVAAGAISGLVGGYVVLQRSKNQDKLLNSSNSNIDSYKNLKLKLVQVVFRHGARTPLSSPDYLPKIKYSEEMLQHGKHTYVPYDTKNIHGEDANISRTIYKQKDNRYGELHHGELTAKGADQMHQLGVILKNHYITGLNFISEEYSDQISVRSTAIKRAVESARCTLAGLFPKQLEPIPIVIASLKSEILFPNFERCEYLKPLTRWSWFFPDLIDGLQKEREEIQTALGIPLETKVHLVTLRDCLFAHDHHEVLPEELNQPHILEKAEIAALKIMDHAFSGYHQTREVALQLGIGPLLKEFLQNMQLSVDNSSPVKMRLFSGHDTTLMPLLRALGLEESFWTPYGANITLELYEDMTKKDETNHLVRVLYQHEEKLIPGCDGIMCPIDKFRKVVSKYILDDAEYARRCAVKDDHLLKSLPKPESTYENK